VTVNRDALALMGALVLEDGRRWGDVAELWQWRLAEWVFDERARPNRWESRPRGGSKSTDIAGICMAAMVELDPAGSRSYTIAVDKDQGRLISEAAAGFVARTPALASALTVDSYKVSANSGSTLEVLAADAASTWGLKPRRVVCDEFCQWPSTANAKGVWTAILTSMGKVAGAKLLCTSTSGDPAHWSHGVYETALKSKAWTVSETPGPLPWVSADFLAEQRLILPDSVYRRLHLNEWCASEDRLTSLDDVRACVTLDGPLERQEGCQYVLSLDLGVRHDRTVAAVMHSERVIDPDGRDVVQRMVLDRMQVWAGTRTNPVDLGEVERWVEFTARAYRAKVVCDPWQAIAMVQRLRSRGLQVEEFTFSQQSTGRLAVALHTTIRDHRLAIPDDEDLIDELVNVRLRETSPNVYRLDHDPDRHDDRAVTLAMAIQTLATVPRPGGPLLYTDEELKTQDFNVALAHARTNGLIPEPVPLLGRAFGGNSAMPDNVSRDDDDKPPPGLAPSPFV
jgi:phage terminase large subunit-like protein